MSRMCLNQNTCNWCIEIILCWRMKEHLFSITRPKFSPRLSRFLWNVLQHFAVLWSNAVSMDAEEEAPLSATAVQLFLLNSALHKTKLHSSQMVREGTLSASMHIKRRLNTSICFVLRQICERSNNIHHSAPETLHAFLISFKNTCSLWFPSSFISKFPRMFDTKTVYTTV